MNRRLMRWNSRRVFWVLLLSVAILFFGTGVPFMPLGVLLWLVLVLVVCLWPRPAAYLPGDKGEKRANRVEYYRKNELWSALRSMRHWQIGPQGDHDATAQIEKQEGWKVRYVTVNSVAAAVGAVGVAGLDLLLAGVLQHLPSGAVLAPPWLDYTARSPWTALFSALTGWLVVKSLAEESRRLADSGAPEESASARPPTALMQSASKEVQSHDQYKAERTQQKAAHQAEKEARRKEKEMKAILKEKMSRVEWRAHRKQQRVQEKTKPEPPPPPLPEPPSADTEEEQPVEKVALWRRLLSVLGRCRRTARTVWLPPKDAGNWRRLLSGASVATTAAVVTVAAVSAELAVRATGAAVSVPLFTAGVLLVGAATGAGLSLQWFVHANARAQRQAWQAWLAETRQWAGWWESIPGLRGRTPQLFVSVPLPEGEDGDPQTQRCVFNLAPGTDFSMVENTARQIAPAMGAALLSVEPFLYDHVSPHSWMFMLTYSHGKYPTNPHLRGDLTQEAMDLAVRAAVVNAFLSLKLGCPINRAVEKFSYHEQAFTPKELADNEPAPAPCIIKSSWMLPRAQAYEAVAKAVTKLQDKLGCEWLRLTRRPEESVFHLYYGSRPDRCHFSPYDEEAKKSEIERLDWEHWFRETGVVVGGRTPANPRSSKGSFDTTIFRFDLPAGLDSATVERATESLRAASGYQYLEVEEGTSPTTCHIRVGDRDPLNDLFLFANYEQEVLHEPVLGEPRTSFVIGMGRDGDLLHYEWDDEQPHLMVAGSSGAGKSGLVNLMLCQMMHNSSPQDVQFWMLEPKNELQAFQYLEHVTVFADQSTSAMSDYDTAAIIFDAAYTEMQRRYHLFSNHPQGPQKLSEARLIAAQDPSASELMLPYIYVVVEECAGYFAKPDSPEDRKGHSKLLQRANELARRSRAAGIYMIVVTQNPTKEAIPPNIKRQCRAIGLAVTEDLASRIIIGQNGLEKITAKGRGLVRVGRGYQPFRSLLMERPASGSQATVDVRAEILQRLPVSTKWPKLVPEVRVSGMVRDLSDELEAQRASAAERMNGWVQRRRQEQEAAAEEERQERSAQMAARKQRAMIEQRMHERQQMRAQRMQADGNDDDLLLRPPPITPGGATIESDDQPPPGPPKLPPRPQRRPRP